MCGLSLIFKKYVKGKFMDSDCGYVWWECGKLPQGLNQFTILQISHLLHRNSWDDLDALDEENLK